MTRIQTVTFDVGGTLIEPWPSVGQVYAAVAAQFGVTALAPEALTANFKAAWQTRVSFDYSRPAWIQIVRQTFGPKAAALPPQFFAALYELFAQASVWRVYADVEPTLEQLPRRGVRLAVISNWDERLRPLLERLHLSPHFEAIFVSSEVGYAKPAPELFRRAATALELPPDAMLHVGDSSREDVAGAQAAGLQAVLLDRQATSSTGGVIRRLTELIEWL